MIVSKYLVKKGVVWGGGIRSKTQSREVNGESVPGESSRPCDTPQTTSAVVMVDDDGLVMIEGRIIHRHGGGGGSMYGAGPQ